MIDLLFFVVQSISDFVPSIWMPWTKTIRIITVCSMMSPPETLVAEANGQVPPGHPPPMAPAMAE